MNIQKDMKIFEIIKSCPHIIIILLETNWTEKKGKGGVTENFFVYLKARYLLDEVASSASRDWFTKKPAELV